MFVMGMVYVLLFVLSMLIVFVNVGLYISVISIVLYVLCIILFFIMNLRLELYVDDGGVLD